MKIDMKRALMSTIVVAAWVAGVAHGKECKGVSVPDQAQVDGSNLTLNGLGLRQATAFKVNVYVAASVMSPRRRATQRLCWERMPRPSSSFSLCATSAPMTSGKGGSAGIRKEFEGSAARAQRSHRRAQRLDGRCKDWRAPDVHPQARYGSRGRHEWRGKGNHQGRRLRQGVPLDLASGTDPPNPEIKAGILGGACG